MTSMLEGRLRLLPGTMLPHGIANTRALSLARVCTGMAAAEVPPVMPRLYALCGAAHELAARLALEAASRHEPVAASTAQLRTLQAQTLREHLRRMWLDWPQQLAGRVPRPQALASLRALWQTGSADAEAASRWVGAHVLGMPPAAWLARAEARATDGLADWMAGAAQEPARLLAACTALPLPELAHLPALEDHLDAAEALGALGHCLLAAPAFAARPVLARSLSPSPSRARREGLCALAPGHGGEDRKEGATVPAHTGCWSRLRRLRPARPHAVIDRLGATLEEVARLAVGQDVLDARAVPLGHAAAVAAVEMSRGLLLHAVQLDAQGRVAGYHVVAPTEWNFHPEGAVAQALARLRADDPAAPRLAGVVAAAFDPCVAFDVVAGHPGEGRRTTIHETQHA